MCTNRAAWIALAFNATALAPAAAQDSDCRILCPPVFVAQPGFVVQNAINPPIIDQQGNEAESATDFLLRFTTVIPTELSRLVLVALVQWFPFNTEDVAGVDYNFNAPAFVYGPVLNLFTAGPLSVSVDAIGVYAPSGVTSDYKHVFALEGILSLSLGEMMGGMSPYLSGIALNALYSQQISDRGRDAEGEKRFTPNLLFLVTLPIAPLPR